MKNEAAWLELFESDVFNDRDDHRYEIVWKIVQSLQHRQNLTSRDVFDLQCLIDVLTLPDPRITQQAEEVARLHSLAKSNNDLARHTEAERKQLRRIVKGWADWYRLADDDDGECEYLNGKGWDDAEALADMSLAALCALNEQPGGDRQKDQN